MESILQSLNNSKYLKWIVLIAAVVFVTWLLSLWLPPAYDFHTYFYPGTRDWLDGGFQDSDWPEFTNTPWVIISSIPFALPSEPIGRALLFVFTVLVIIFVSREVPSRKYSLAFVFLSIPALGVVWVGALEAYSLFGIGLCAFAIRRRQPWIFSIGFPLLFIKPTETILVALFLLWAIRGWRKEEWLRVAVGPVIAISAALIFFDLEWITKLAQKSTQLQEIWTPISIWWRFTPFWFAALCSIVTALLGLWLTFRLRFTSYSLALITAFGAFSTPYLHTHHLILPMVFSWPYLFMRKPILGLISYLTTLLAFVRLSGDQGLAWLDFFFPTSLVLFLLVFYREYSKEGSNVNS
jgi:hypothetical protein